MRERPSSVAAVDWNVGGEKWAWAGGKRLEVKFK
jgi:hypothetical protein